MMPVPPPDLSRRSRRLKLVVRARAHDKVSGIGALIVSPRRRRFTLALALYPRLNIRGPQVLRFLRHLLRHGAAG